MNVREYLQKKYSVEVPSSIKASEARIFGMPYPLESGWLENYGHIVITDSMRARLIMSLQSSNRQYHAEALIALGAPAVFVDQQEIANSKRAEKLSRKRARQRNAVAALEQKIERAKILADWRKLQPTYERPGPVDGPVRKPKKQRSQKLERTMVEGVSVTSDDFLRTYAWRTARMVALKKYGPVCQCCGASPATGAVMNVDHIKPRKLFPQLALDVDNLQVLCGDCNAGKGNWDMTDWRPPEQSDLDADALAHMRAIAAE